MPELQKFFNSELSRIVKQYNLDPQKIAVAVSGGADSLALAFLMRQYACEFGSIVVALTVNHNLRAEAKEEAEYVADLMRKCGIEHHILEWKHSKLESGIETKAREARYDLLINWCRQNGVGYLFTAHHLRDQAETFLMRLQRGSGVDGLAAMSDVVERDEVRIVRPLLNIEPQKLRDFLRERQIAWKEDASNECDDFLRVRVRKMLPELENRLGITIKKIGNAVNALNGAKRYFAVQVSDFIENRCRNWYGCAWSFNPERFRQLHDEIKIRVISELIKDIGDENYSPEYEALERLCNAISDDNFKGATLGKCEILKFNRRIWIVPENKSDLVLSKDAWNEYALHNPSILMHGLPYKLKLNLFEKSCKAVEFNK